MIEHRAGEFPVLETERLLMRVPDERDFEPLAAMYADPEVMRFIGGTIDRETSWRTLATFIGHWHLCGYGLYSIIEKSSGEFIGRTGLVYPEGWPALEVGWSLCRHAWGKGYATESAAAILDHELARVRPQKLISLVDLRNEASARVAAKLGGFVCGQGELYGSMVEIFAYNVPDKPQAPA